MESEACSYPILFSTFLLIFTALRICYKFKAKRCTVSKLPPGPRKLPLIGNLHQFFGTVPLRAFRDFAREHGPLMLLQLGEVPHAVVSSAELAKEVLKTHDLTFASRPKLFAANVVSYGGRDIAFAPYGEYWRQVRKISIMEFLGPKRIQSFQRIREDEYSNLAKWAASNAGSPVNLSEKLRSSIFGVISRIAFGKKRKEHEEFIAVIIETLKLAAGTDLGDLFPSMKLLHFFRGLTSSLEKMHIKADRIMDNIIEEHRERRKIKRSDVSPSEDDDLVDVFLGFAENGGPEFSLSTNNVKALILDAFGAGADTSATTVDWAMAEIIKNPRILKKAQAEMRVIFGKRGKVVDETGLQELKYLKMVIKETLRMHPPVPLLLPRECGQQCEINGYQIPLKSRVLVNVWAIGRDPKYWNDPETFYPERFTDNSIDFKGTNFEYIPFGAGRRMCPGMSFGLVNVELALAMLLYYLDWELPSGMKNEDLDMIESSKVLQRRKDDLILIPKPYKPSFL